MSDPAQLAGLSHALERVALALSRDDADDCRVEHYLAELAGGQREVLAMALSFALRRQALNEDPVTERAIARLEATLGGAAPGR